ncbi:MULTISPECIES: branched-chain amino acid ABC transporter permease [Amycolatopsis]|uniref:Amino acid/amide ABC transporter membrane protein 1 (HAAT family) n=1 Tax=Amycolatopsis thermoflava TaxID=84480 RepID=A0A3N2G798_9PSEU|nr:branched-chain amino acid ABC transporter permease [Amycolatopsis thermoflava]ROS32079.1 amino acid/amide ABC transporter membrane protein 1 (HAAT family) [Amycolatopsis thermoflava]
MNFAQLLNGIAFGSLLMILSSGLAMIYGLRGVTNFSHGALYMAGAYLAYSVSANFSFWLALVVAPAVLAVLGAVLELVFFRRLQHRSHIEVGLVTFGVAMVLERVIVLIWGERTLAVAPPAGLGGTTSVFGVDYPSYRLLIIGFAVVLAVGLTWWLRASRLGLHIRAASRDGQTAQILGINADRVSLVVVCLGAALAGLAGALAAPYVSVDPGMGVAILINVLIVVVIGGAGSIAGAMTAGMALGVVQTLGAVWLPSVAVLVPYAALVAVLLWRPAGLFGRQA